MKNAMDHRALAGEMEICFFDEEIGAGLPLWLPNGVAIREALEAFIAALERKAGYQRVVSPHMASEALYLRSGHIPAFAREMFPPMQLEGGERRFYLKPMNCPHHHKIFGAVPRSYRQLPLRLAEYGQVYRFEPSGALKGLSRVRGLCQNDAHIYVEPAKALNEVLSVLSLFEECYGRLGLRDYRYRLSLGDPARPEDFPGDPDSWRRCEEILREALHRKGLAFFEARGEAAFYGPKIDVQMPFSAGREESVASVQLDFLSGERFDLAYVDASGARRRPYVIHRAPLGSHERFVALLLEHFQGRLPAWLSPVQVYILPVSQEEAEFAAEIHRDLSARGIRVEMDSSPSRLAKRLREAHRLRPFAFLVIGSKERDSGAFRLQLRNANIEVPRAELPSRLSEMCRPPLGKE